MFLSTVEEDSSVSSPIRMRWLMPGRASFCQQHLKFRALGKPNVVMCKKGQICWVHWYGVSDSSYCWKRTSAFWGWGSPNENFCLIILTNSIRCGGGGQMACLSEFDDIALQPYTSAYIPPSLPMYEEFRCRDSIWQRCREEG